MSKRLSRLSQAAAWLLLAAVFAYVCRFLSQKIDFLLNADMSSVLVVSKMLQQEGVLLTPNFYYSTWPYVISMQLVFAPLFCLTGNWHVVRLAGTVLLLLIYLACAYALCRQLKLRRWFPLTGIMLLLPLSDAYMEMYITGVFYISHTCIVFGLLALSLRLLQQPRVRTGVLLYALGGFLSVAAGMEGLRILLVYCLPMLLAAVLWYWDCYKRQEALDQPRRLLVFNGFCCAAYVAGVAIYLLVLEKRLHLHSQTSLSFTPFSFQNLGLVFQDWLGALGYRSGPAFSTALVFNATALLLAVLMVGLVAASLRRKSDLPIQQRLAGWFLAAAYLVYALLYAFTDQLYSWRYQLPFLMVFFCLLPAVCQNWRAGPRVKAAAAAAFMALFGLCGLQLYREYGALDYSGEHIDIAQAMVEQGYSYGYSQFWYPGNTLTELSDGQLELHIWPDAEESPGGIVSDFDAAKEWLQAVRHKTEKPDGPFFVVINKYQTGNYAFYPAFRREDLVYESPSYWVYGFDSYDQLASRF